MQCQIRHLVRYAKAQGYTVSVYDGEEWAVKKSSNEHEIMSAIESVEEADLRIGNAKDEKMGWAKVIPELEPDERVADCTANAFMDAWTAAYEADTSNPPPKAKAPGM